MVIALDFALIIVFVIAVVITLVIAVVIYISSQLHLAMITYSYR